MATTLLTSDLRDFVRKAGHITGKPIPITEYVRLIATGTEATLHKTNLYEHIVYQCGYDGDPIDCCIDEHVLSSAVLSESEHLTIQCKGDMLHVGSISHKLPDADYPALPELAASYIPLPEEEQLHMASAFAVMPDLTKIQAPMTNYVHLYKGYVYATDGRQYVYLNQVEYPDNLLVSRKVLPLLTGTGWQYAKGSDHDWYRNEHMTWVFPKPNCGTPDFTRQIESYYSATLFKLTRSELLDYLRVTVALHKPSMNVPEALVRITTTDEGVEFNYQDVLTNIVTFSVPCISGHSIVVQARYLLKIINTLHHETFSFSMPNQGMVIIRSCDQQYLAALMGVNTGTV